jgi:hypothetical protein
MLRGSNCLLHLPCTVLLRGEPGKILITYTSLLHKRVTKKEKQEEWNILDICATTFFAEKFLVHGVL